MFTGMIINVIAACVNRLFAWYLEELQWSVDRSSGFWYLAWKSGNLHRQDYFYETFLWDTMNVKFNNYTISEH